MVTDGKHIEDEMLEDEEEEQQENKFLTFSISDETYGINILSVVEIIQIVEITKIPESLDYIKGIINLRGKIIPVMNVRLRFAMEEKEYDERTCIVVVNIHGIQMGMIVDAVSEVTEIPQDYIETMPSTSNAEQNKYVQGIGKTNEGVTILLDLDKLVGQEDVAHLNQINNK